MVKTTEQRFLEKFEEGDAYSCWIWNAAKCSNRYGSFRYEGKTRGAHRFSWEYYNQSRIPEKMVVDHLCRNPSCVNPRHLDIVPMLVNTLRGRLIETHKNNAKKKINCKRGHNLSGENLTIDKRGHRACKACQAQKGKEWKQKNRDRVNYLQQLRRKKK